MLSSMAKIQIVGTKRVLDRAIRALHELGTVQIEDVTREIKPTDALLQRMSPRAAEKEHLEAGLARVNAVLGLLPPRPHAAPPKPPQVKDGSAMLAALEEELRQVEPVCAELATRRTELEAELANLRQYRSIISKLMPLVEGMVELEGFETVAILIQQKYRIALDLIKRELARITHDQFEIISADVDEESAAAIIVFNKSHSAAVHGLLRGENLNEVRLPRAYANTSFKAALAMIREREAAIPTEQAEIARRLDELADEWRPRILAWRDAVWDRIDELTVIGRLAESTHAFILTGWVPRKQLARVRSALAGVSDELELTELELTPEEERQAPVLLENPRVIRPFEFLMSILAPPKYGTIDPTPFLAVFFPLFFGLILGDVAYGLILLGVSLWILRNRSKPEWLVQLSRIFVICSVSSIAFGFAYGEFLGNLGEHFGMRPLVVDRMTAILPVLVFCVALGAVHVTLGLVLGIVNGFLERKKKEILGKVATMVALAALFAVVGVAAHVLPSELLRPGIAALVVALAVLIGTVGIIGPLEVFGVVGNILSYARLMAIGLSSVMLAKVANDLAGVMGNVVLGVIVAGLFHALNVALGAFSPSIQSLRLHYVEFFGKFYETGGQRFQPFRRSERPEPELAGQRR